MREGDMVEITTQNLKGTMSLELQPFPQDKGVPHSNRMKSNVADPLRTQLFVDIRNAFQMWACFRNLLPRWKIFRHNPDWQYSGEETQDL